MPWIGNWLLRLGGILWLFAVPARQALAHSPVDQGGEAARTAAYMDSLVGRFTGAQPEYINQISPLRVANDPTASFYYLLFLSLLLGGLHYSHPRYIPNLLRALRSPGTWTRQAQEEVSTSLPALLMNLIFVLTAAAFLYHAAGNFLPSYLPLAKQGKILAYISLGLFLVYLVKFLYFRFCGWMFQMQSLARHYLYQVFLINQIMVLLLLPAGFFLAIGKESLRAPVFWAVTTLMIFLLINRYTRSWPQFAPLVRNHRFHFFAYLCASEILPMAVIMKLLFLSLPR